eukprot:3376887-Pleurochrysis_carterae.AAC.3
MIVECAGSGCPRLSRRLACRQPRLQQCVRRPMNEAEIPQPRRQRRPRHGRGIVSGTHVSVRHHGSNTLRTARRTPPRGCKIANYVSSKTMQVVRNVDGSTRTVPEASKQRGAANEQGVASGRPTRALPRLGGNAPSRGLERRTEEVGVGGPSGHGAQPNLVKRGPSRLVGPAPGRPRVGTDQ